MTTVAEEIPYAATVSSDLLSEVCSGCFLRNSQLKRCARCRTLYYCSANCQKDDWADHKGECLQLANVAPRVPSSIARLMLRIILKLKREAESEHKFQAFNGRIFEQLIDHKSEIQKDPARCEFFMCVSQVLYQFAGPELCRPADKLMILFCKLLINSIGILDDNLQSIGTGLYIGLSVHDHSCCPDAFVLFSGKKALLRVPRNQAQYSLTLTISYIDLMCTNSRRRADLREQYYFTCICALCQDSRRDALARSVCCMRCRVGACPLENEPHTLTCIECGQPQEMTYDEALHANQGLEWEIERAELDKSSEISNQLKKTIEQYEKYATKLSNLNMKLAVFAQRILSGAFQLKRTDLLEKYAFVSVKAYKEYLPIGHPELSLRLLLAAEAAASGQHLTHNIVTVIEEAHASLLISHGPRHPLCAQADAMKTNVRARLYTQN